MTNLPDHNPGAILEPEAPSLTPEEIVAILAEYRTVAENARKGGTNARDAVWRSNWERYWNRYSDAGKADWQSRHVMPETPQFVDRWAAAMREALDSNPEFFTVVDETAQSPEVAAMVSRVLRLLLTRAGTTAEGRVVDFSSVFEDQMKMGAIMAMCASVTWKDDAQGGRVAVDTVDPREYWRDPTRRDLYRLRQYEIDRYELLGLSQLVDGEGQPLYDIAAIRKLASEVDEKARIERERSSGGSEGDGHGTRKPILIEEWLCTLLNNEGELVASNALVIVANRRTVIRGPEPNPFWHGSDWVLFAPMVSVPLSIYGRTYMEEWSSVADAFIDMTQLVLDGALLSAINAYVGDSTALRDPTQVAEGIAPGAFLDLEPGMAGRQVLEKLDLGNVSATAIQVWQALKQELREGAKLSEIALGQVPSAGRVTATAVNQSTQAGSAMIRSMALTIETRFLEPMLTLIWQTAMQHMDFQTLAHELGEDTAAMLNARRGEFASRRFRFRVRGISGLIERQAKLQNMLGMLQVVGQNELLLQALLAKADVDRILTLLITLFGVDPSTIMLSRAEQISRQVQQAQQGSQGPQRPQGPQAPQAPTAPQTGVIPVGPQP